LRRRTRRFSYGYESVDEPNVKYKFYYFEGWFYMTLATIIWRWWNGRQRCL